MSIFAFIHPRCKNGTLSNRMEACLILLRRLSYPCRLSDLVDMFGLAAEEISMIFNKTLDIVYERNEHLLKDFGNLQVLFKNVYSKMLFQFDFKIMFQFHLSCLLTHLSLYLFNWIFIIWKFFDLFSIQFLNLNTQSTINNPCFRPIPTRENTQWSAPSLDNLETNMDSLNPRADLRWPERA